MSDRERPAYRGIRTYRDPFGRFLFRYPVDWHQFDLSDGRDGVLFSPEPENPTTWFSIWSTRLPDHVVAEDMDILREGVNEGLRQLDDLHVEFESEDVFGDLCRFERIYRFQEDALNPKRRVWILYVHNWQFVLMAQGTSAEEYQHWYPMLSDFFDTFDLAPTLWFATDRELTNRSDS